jgi:hypothetical protein
MARKPSLISDAAFKPLAAKSLSETLYVFSAKGAAFTASLGQRPRIRGQIAC